ncbi:hypothetical protein Tco_1147331 [Tanacetum coccineum]
MVVLMLCYFIRIMDPTSSLGRICLGENVYGSSSEKVAGHGDWDAPEYTDTASSKEKKVTKALSFYKMETEEVSKWYIAPCFVNGLDAYDGEINLALDENLISNEFAVKLCLDYEVKKGNKGVITVYPEQDLLEDDSEKTEKSMDDWDQLLDSTLMIYHSWVEKNFSHVGPSSSTGRYLTQEDAANEALALRISQKFALLEEVRPILETMAYNDKYKKVLDEIWKDKVELDGMIVREEEEAINKFKGEALKEKDDPRAFIFPIRFEGKVNKNSLADTGSDINTMPYQIYEKLGREQIKKVVRGIIMINHTQAEPMGILTNVLFGRGFLYTIGGIVNTPERLFLTFDEICHQTFRAARSDVLRTAKRNSNDEEEYEIKRNKFGAPIYGPKPAAYLNCNNPAERSLPLQAVTNLSRRLVSRKRPLVSLVHYMYRCNTLTGNLITRVVIQTKRKQKDSGVLR